MFVEGNLRAFAEALAARAPTPGGGSAAACFAACGAALGAMVLRFTTGKKFEEVAPEMAAGAAVLDALREAALRGVDEDAEAYERVRAAQGKPKGTEAEKAERARAVKEALLGATEVPLETMRIATEALEALAPRAGRANGNLASDLAGAAAALGAALETAEANVRVNASSLGDDAEGTERLARARALRARAGAARETVLRAVEARLGPSG